VDIESGQSLLHYRFVEKIGEGGMGVVWKAIDTTLEREVAIKILPPKIAADPDRRARFEREAKAVAALSHPNILAIYDFNSIDGTSFVVTELLEGETLRERLERGAIAPRKAAELGRQVARGLAAAHDKGIVHRDLKPENLFVTHDGRIKILDFGLATAEGGGAEGATRTSLTAPGTVMGTVGYMSPEQVRGEAVDARSDIFSFGAVLYEMASGSRPFVADTQAETMTAILKEEPPDLASTSAEMPPALATIVRRCIEKRAGERFQSAHDLAFSLEGLSDVTVPSGATRAVTASVAEQPRKSGRRSVGLILLGIALGVALGVAAAAMLLRPAPTALPEFSRLTSRRGTVTNARFMPGEQSAVYSATWEGGPLQLFSAGPGATGSRPLPFDGAELLSVSSTGQLALALDRHFPLGWEAVGTLAVVRPEGSAPRAILENVLVADWGPDGENLAVAHEVDGVVRLEYPIGTVLHESLGWISALRVHPDGDRIAFSDNPIRGDNRAEIKIVNRQGVVETVTPGGSWGLLWSADGREILFGNGGNVSAVRPGEAPREIYRGLSGIHLLDVNASNDLLIGATMIRREMFGRGAENDQDINLSWLDWSTPRDLVRDGSGVVFEEGNQVEEDGYAMYLGGLDGSAPVPLGYGTSLTVSPNGRWVVIVKRPFSAEPELVLMPTGPGESRRLPLGDLRIRQWGASWVPGSESSFDQGAIVFVARAPDAPSRLYHLSLTGDSAPVPITPEDFPLAPRGTAVSPDGSLVLALSADGVVMQFPIEGGDPIPAPLVRPGELALGFDDDGRHLFVQTTSTVPARIVRVNLDSGQRTAWRELSPADPTGVFTVDYVQISGDGEAYVYSCRRMVSRLMLIEGLQY